MASVLACKLRSAVGGYGAPTSLRTNLPFVGTGGGTHRMTTAGQRRRCMPTAGTQLGGRSRLSLSALCASCVRRGRCCAQQSLLACCPSLLPTEAVRHLGRETSNVSALSRRHRSKFHRCLPRRSAIGSAEATNVRAKACNRCELRLSRLISTAAMCSPILCTAVAARKWLVCQNDHFPRPIRGRPRNHNCMEI